MPSLLDFIGTLAQQSVPMVAGAMRGKQARQQQDRKDAAEARQQQATMQNYLLHEAQLEEDRRHNKAVEDAAVTRQSAPTAYGGRTREQWLADHAAEADVDGRTRARYRAGDSDGGSGQFTRLQQHNIARQQAEAQMRMRVRAVGGHAIRPEDYERISQASGGAISRAELVDIATDEFRNSDEYRRSHRRGGGTSAPVVRTTP